MFRLIIAVLVLATACAPAWAQMYRCEQDDGRTVFQDRPCAGQGQEITVTPATGRADPAQAAERMEQLRDRGEQAQQNLTIRQIDRDIRRVESRMQRVRDNMDAELEQLRQRKRYAANNLAGATWQASISQEMQAVVEQHRAEETALAAELQRLHGERRELASR